MFRNYIARRRMEGRPPGRFAVYAQEDRDLPDAKTWEDLEAYLVGKASKPEVIDEAAGFWRDYLDSPEARNAPPTIGAP